MLRVHLKMKTKNTLSDKARSTGSQENRQKEERQETMSILLVRKVDKRTARMNAQGASVEADTRR